MAHVSFPKTLPLVTGKGGRVTSYGANSAREAGGAGVPALSPVTPPVNSGTRIREGSAPRVVRVEHPLRRAAAAADLVDVPTPEPTPPE